MIKFKIANTVSNAVRITTGQIQGDSLSSVSFNLVLERVIRELNVTNGITLG